MVKKLFKHEFFAFWRVMVIVYAILLTVAGAGRIIQFFETDSTTYAIVFRFSCTTYGISVAAALGFAFVLGIVRFYKNLFSAEGYLTHTLPVTPSQHIWVKAITAVSVQLVTILVVLLSGCIITAGDMLSEIWKSAMYLLDKVFGAIGFQGVVIGLELLVFLILVLFSNLMLYYTCISIGQLSKKNRILAAVGAYFVYYILSQVVSTILLVVVSMLSVSGVLDRFVARLMIFSLQHPYILVHSTIWIFALLPIAAILVEFLIIRRIISRKLNLE